MVEEGNVFLKQYLAGHNQPFSVDPQEREKFHRLSPPGINLFNVMYVEGLQIGRHTYERRKPIISIGMPE